MAMPWNKSNTVNCNGPDRELERNSPWNGQRNSPWNLFQDRPLMDKVMVYGLDHGMNCVLDHGIEHRTDKGL